MQRRIYVKKKRKKKKCISVFYETQTKRILALCIPRKHASGVLPEICTASNNFYPLPQIYAFLNKCSTSNQILTMLEFVHFLLKFDTSKHFPGNIKRLPSCLTYCVVWNFFFITSWYSLEITPLLESFGYAPINILSIGSSRSVLFLKLWSK